MGLAVGIDIGGTKIAIGLVDENGQVAARTSLPTDLTVSPSEMMGRVQEAVHGLLAERSVTPEKLAGIGVGAPGPLDPKGGRLVCPPNLRSWWDFPVTAELAKYFSCPIRMENDATAATLAEHWVGVAQGMDHFVYITISTGIGSGLFVNGKLFTGASGNAGDVGHIVIDPSAGRCVCGQLGCWEWVASGTAIARQASELLGRAVTTQEAFELAASGDRDVSALVDKVYTYIGMGCVTLINTLDPEMIVIGGGVSQVGETLFRAVQAYVSEKALNPSGRKTRIVPAVLQRDVGLIGAAALVHVDY